MLSGPAMPVARANTSAKAALAESDGSSNRSARVGAPTAAAMKATELGLAWLVRGDLNIGQGWMNRARRLLAGAEEGPAHGYLAYLDANIAAMTLDLDTLDTHVRALRDLGERLNTPAVTALGLIIGGIEAGMETILVLSGVTAREDVGRCAYQPAHVRESVADITP